MRRVERAIRTAQRLDADARRDNVGLGTIVNGRRAAGTERRDVVVAAIGRPHMARRTDSEHPRRIARRRHTAVPLASLTVAAIVAAGCHDDDASLHGTFGRQGQGIGFVRLVNTRRHRHIDDANIERVLQGNGVIECGDDVADVAATGAVQDFEHHQVRGWCNAGPRAARIEAVAGDDAGDVCAVAIVVVRGVEPVHEVDEMIDARSTSRRGEIVMRGRHTRVDDRDADTRPVVTQILPHDRGADCRARALIRTDDRAVN